MSETPMRDYLKSQIGKADWKDIAERAMQDLADFELNQPNLTKRARDAEEKTSYWQGQAAIYINEIHKLEKGLRRWQRRAMRISDYRNLLKCYMEQVIEAEGVSFAGGTFPEWSPGQKELDKIESEIMRGEDEH